MKKWIRRLLPLFITFVVSVIVVHIGVAYLHFISRRIYQDSTDHLAEIYSQVNRSFSVFIERNWGILNNWGKYLALPESGDGSFFSELIADEQDYWGFSEFYFLSEDGSCMTLGGAGEEIDLGEARDSLMQRQEAVMTGDTLSDGQEITLFAVPVQQGEYKGFSFDAIGISYTNADLAASLNVNAFSGKSRCFVLHKDGVVLLSTQTGGNIFENYLIYLKAASDLKEEELERIRTDWEEGKSGLLRCSIGDVSSCILYQPLGYQDYIMLSTVPRSAVSAGFLAVQKVTMNVLILIFLLVGAVIITFVILRSNSQSRKSRMELLYRECMFDVLSNNVDDIFLMLDSADQKVDYISPNIERLLGIPAEEARRDIRVMEKCAVNRETIIPEEEFTSIPLHGNRSWECEYIHQNTGEQRWYRLSVYHMSIQNVEKHIIVLSDRTREQQMNQNLQEALTAARSANKAKSNFLSNMSHDIRTPMNAIVGFSVLLEKDADNPEKVRDYTRKITASSQHLLSLINDVLDMSKIESGKTSLNVDRFSLPELLDELNIILLPQAKAKNQTFEIHVEGAPPKQLLGDRLRLNQILINLLSNAIKYTPDGGRIEFMVGEIPQSGQQYVKLRFTVRDNGIGMSEEFQEQIFTPFSREISSVTNKIQGTGLGMAITKNLVDLMGGIIQVQSQPGKGSTFTVELSFMPAGQEETETDDQEQAEPDEVSAQSVMEGCLFLVAEDNEMNAEILTEMLDMEGAGCEVAANGREALEMFRNSAPGHYDMILMDVQMPVMNGYEATREIRACGHPEAASIPIVAMTANTFAEDVRDAMDAGMNGHLGKPIDMKAVRELIGRLVNKPSQRENPHENQTG